MILGRFSRHSTVETEEPKGFDSFDLRLGDLMRGERATMGKSLLDVERELRIKASYVAAIENANPDAFDTPGFIPGYVRSYARYLGMDPDRAFATFCTESGFSIAHGMSPSASSVRRGDTPVSRSIGRSDARLTAPSTPFIPASESVFSRIEPGAIGSVAVLIALIGAIGYGGWSVLSEVQRVQVTPVENTPDVLADLDPLAGVTRRAPRTDEGADSEAGMTAPESETLDRLYRPEALDVPVLVARDGPISTLDPMRGGTLPSAPGVSVASSRFGAAQTREIAGADTTTPANPDTNAGAEPTAIDAAISSVISPQVLAEAPSGVQMVAVRPAWVRVRSADGTVIFEGVMNGGDTYDVPLTELPPTLRVGASGAIYFKVGGKHYGPAGPRGAVTSNMALAPQELTGNLEVADITQDSDLERYVAQLGDYLAAPALPEASE